MEELWPYVKDEITKLYIGPERWLDICQNKKLKYGIHTIFWTSESLPKRIELGDANECNTYHFFFYMIARFYYVDNGGEILYYYPNKYNHYFPERGLALLPSRFKREFVKTPGYEYVELPACKWEECSIDEPWIYDYVKNLYKDIWKSTSQIKGKYTYISRNKREVKGRRMLNEEELLLPLKRKGFSVYTLDHMTFEEQIRLFRSSEIITGLPGAGMAWLIFCEPQTIFLEVAYPGSLQDHKKHYQHVCHSCNLQYYRYEKINPPNKEIFPDANHDDCVIDPTEYTRVLESLVLLNNNDKNKEQS